MIRKAVKVSKPDLLDEVRLENTTAGTIEYFRSTLDKNPDGAVGLINDKNLKFPALYIVLPEINSRAGLLPQLTGRNRISVEIVNNTINETLRSDLFTSENRQDYYDAFKWILRTGYRDDGLDPQYDEIVEKAAIALAKVYKDKESMKIIEELIFNRYRREAPIYDLVWAYFDTLTPDNLTAVIERLRSSDKKDIELARKLLNFIPCIENNIEDTPEKQYRCCLNWLAQNQDYLYYTGETFLQTGNPHRYAVSLEAKYLHKNVSNIKEEATRAVSSSEKRLLDSFSKLEDDQKLSLSEYSDMLYRKNRQRWSQWLNESINKQIEISGGHYDNNRK